MHKIIHNLCNISGFILTLSNISFINKPLNHSC